MKMFKKLAFAALAGLAMMSAPVMAAVDPAITTAITTAQTDGVTLVSSGVVAVITIVTILVGVGILFRVFGKS